jgi:acyl-homoserine lactone acylase PvdQ
MRLPAHHFTDPIRSYTAHNYGQSGRPESPHYEDQAAKLTSAGKLKPVYFDKTELMPHVKSERTLDVPPL